MVLFLYMYQRGSLKVQLFLAPQALEELGEVFSSYHIEKIGNAMPVATVKQLTNAEVERYFFNEESAAYNALSHFTIDSIWDHYQLLKKDFGKQKGAAATEQLLFKATLRHIHSLFKNIWHHLNQLKVYHSGLNKTTGKALRQACSFKQEEVALSFSCYKTEDNAIYIQPLITIGKEEPISVYEFNRTLFLLEKNNEYLLLNHADSNLLDWFDEQDLEQNANDPEYLLSKIIPKLEHKNLVERNDCFEEILLEEMPQGAIRLSELNNKYLMLSPRWYYEGMLTEGNFKEVEEHIVADEIYKIKRNKEAEDYLNNFIKSSHPSFKNQNNGFYYVTFEEANKKQWFQNLYHNLLENKIELEGLDMMKHYRYSPLTPETKIELKSKQNNVLSLAITTKFGKELLSNTDIQKIIQSGQKSILLKDNSIGILTEDWLALNAQYYKYGKINDGLIYFNNIHLLQKQEADWDKNSVDKTVWMQQWQHWQSSEEKLFELPTIFTANLRPYQSKGVEWLILLSKIGAGAILADDMGLGKTIQSIAFLAYTQQQNAQAKTIIICPTSLVYNWLNELTQFCGRLTSSVFTSEDNVMDALAKNDVIIVSYGIFRNNVQEFATHYWENIIIDESQNIKNINSLITKAVYLLNGKNRIALSGTPIMNNTFELFAQMDFTNPDYLGHSSFFRNYFATPIDKNKSKLKVEELKQLTEAFILRRTKEQVATDLPSKTVDTLWCEMDKTQFAVYEEVRQQIKDNVLTKVKEDGIGKHTMSILAGIQKLRQICAAPWLVENTMETSNQSIKITTLFEELQKHLNNHKVLIFSQFLGVLDGISTYCTANNIKFFRLDGSTPQKERQRQIDAFQKEDEARVFLLSLKAGNAGITLTEADYVYLVDPWWNTAVENQAIDRAHRIGQLKNVFAYKMICKNTIEEKIQQLQKQKAALADDLINAEEGFVKQLTTEDIAYIFN